MSDTAIRLAKRVAEMAPCSRADAERYIAGGWITVDGQLAEDPAMRVEDTQDVVIDPKAKTDEPLPVTILLHKPAGVNSGVGSAGEAALSLLTEANLQVADHGRQRFLKRHLSKLTLTSPLETMASGLVIYTQDFRVARKLVDDAERVEQEYVVEVAGTIAEGGLALLNFGLKFSGKPIPQMKVSWQNETRLRFALKGVRPGQLAHMCEAVGLTVVSIKRLRIGRISMAGVPVGMWRYLHEYERF